MKAEAYRCDVCLTLVHAEDAVGVRPVEDLFDRVKSFPTVLNPAKADIHYCLQCYRSKVIDAAIATVNRKRDEEGYKQQLAVLGYNLRKLAVKNYAIKHQHKTNEQ